MGGVADPNDERFDQAESKMNQLLNSQRNFQLPILPASIHAHNWDAVSRYAP